MLDRLVSDEAKDFMHPRGQKWGSPDASDAVILDYAREEGRVIVTLDADFHTLLALTGATFPSVVRVRIEGLRA
jgi:predicted nuclease of predicted toxin-antitoxin system